MGSPTQSGWRGLGMWRIPVGSATSPHDGKASGAADRRTRPSCRTGIPQATSPNCDRSRERWIISIRRRWETVSNAFEMSTAMAIVPLGDLGWLKPETTLAEMGSRPRRGSALVWSRAGRSVYPVPPRCMGRGTAPLFSLPGRAVRWGGRSDPGLVASLPLKSGLWRSSSKLPGCKLRQLRDWRAPSGRPYRAHQDGGGGARWARQAPGGGTYGRCDDSLLELLVWMVHTVVVVEDPHEPFECPTVLSGTGSELPVEGLCNSLQAWVGLRCLVGYLSSCRLACAEKTSSSWDWWRCRRIPRGSSTGLALPGKWAARCPGPAQMTP